MENITIKNFKANFELDLVEDLHIIIHIDEDMEGLAKEENGAGETYVRCRVRIRDDREDENYEYEYGFALYIRINRIRDLFVNEVWQILRHWRKIDFLDWIDETNPKHAWLFYKRTFDKVMNGAIMQKACLFTYELELESKGRIIQLKHFEDGAERIFEGDKYLGRIDTVMNGEALQVLDDYVFFFDPKDSTKFELAEYEPFFGGTDILVETGIRINHRGSFREILSGVVLAAKRFNESK